MIVFKQIKDSFPNDSTEDFAGSLSIDSLDGQLMLGRCEITGICDKRCSRDHMKITFDKDNDELVFQQLGSNSGCIHFQDKEFMLSRKAVKRLPINNKTIEDKSKFATIYLIQKDHLYGYEVSVSKELLQKQQENGESSKKNATSLKRKSSTLDDFMIKKHKPDAKIEKGTWTEVEEKVYFLDMPGVKASAKIAAFDMDYTLITTISGAKWPKSKDDWKFLYPDIPEKVQKVSSDGYKVLIFTNQGSIANGRLDPAEIQYKIEKIVDKLSTPVQAIICGSKKGVFRKPMTGMWDYIAERANDGVKVDLSQSYYVGDAAGRVENWAPQRKKDFANSDRLFALNVGVKFYTPEAYFRGEKEGKYEMPEFIPSEAFNSKDLFDPPTVKPASDKQEIIVMVGFPGSGKSHFSTNHLSSYKRVNRDTLGSWQKCVAKCEEYVEAGMSVVVDNTNPDEESRGRYIAIGKKHKVPVRCFLMSTSYKQARHNEKFRQLTQPNHKSIPDMVVHSYKKKYKEPEVNEGFAEVVKVNLLPEFENEAHEKLYKMYLLEK